MRRRRLGTGLIALVGAGACAGAASAQGGPQLQIDHAAARLVVIAEARRDVSVSIQQGPSHLPPLTVRREGARIVVDGGLQRPGGAMTISCVGGMTRNADAVFGHPASRERDTRAVLAPSS